VQGSGGIRTLAGTTNLRDIGYLDGNDKVLLQQDIDSKGRQIELTYNSTTERLNVYLKDKDSTTISSSYVDLILEGLVVAGSYDATNKNIELELKDVADPLIIPLGDLVDGLLETTDEANKIYGTDENGEQKLYSTDDLGGKKTATFTVATGRTQYMVTNELQKTSIGVNVYNAHGNEIGITPNVGVGSISFLISQEAAEAYNGATFTVVYG
jgi:hypothetical protein